MSAEKSPETFRSKLVLLLIDKALLGALLALMAYWLNVSLQQQGKGIDYQKTIFDRRVEAYLDVLQKAQRVTDELAQYWISQSNTGSSARLSDLEARWRRLSDRSGFGSGGSDSSWSTVGDLLPLLKDLESSWRSKSIYFSAPVSAAVDEFLRTVYADVSTELSELEQARPTDAPAQRNTRTAFERAAWLRAQQAFKKLTTEIETRLKLSGIILG